jgi:hypothetical protein
MSAACRPSLSAGVYSEQNNANFLKKIRKYSALPLCISILVFLHSAHLYLHISYFFQIKFGCRILIFTIIFKVLRRIFGLAFPKSHILSAKVMLIKHLPHYISIPHKFFFKSKAKCSTFKIAPYKPIIK